MIHLGSVPASTTIYVPFATYAGSTGASVTCTGLAVTDVEIYKNGSVTQRSSDAGIALLDTDGIDFDGITGLHGFSIDLSDNTDASFYAVGSWYWVVVSAITVDSQTVTFLAATFRIAPAESLTGHPKTDVGGWLGTAAVTPTVAGVPEVDITHLLGTAWLTPSVAGTPDVNAKQFGGAAVTATTSVTIPASSTLATTAGAVASVTGAVGSVAGNVVGSVGSIAAGGIAAASFAAGAIDASAIAADAIGSSELAASAITEIAAGVWDEVLTAGTHNIASSAGRRLRTLQTGGNYEGGMVWVDTVAGVSGTTVDENGVVTNPVLNWSEALTLAAGIPLKAFHIANGSTVTLSAASTNYVLVGHEWTLALGSQNIAASMFIDASVSGTGSGSAAEFETCEIQNASIADANFHECAFSATLTLNAAGDYMFADCYSHVAGSGAPVFDFTGAGTKTASFRRWSGGMTINNISSSHTISIDAVSGGTITLNGADGSVSVRGMVNIVDNRTGTPTLVTTNNMDTRLDSIDSQLTLIVADTNELQTDWANGGRLDLILDAAGSAGDPWVTLLPGAYGAGTAGKIIGDNINATVSSRASQTSVDTIDSIVDSILLDTAEIGTAGAGLTSIPWAAAWDAEVQSEVNDALVAFWTSPATLVDLVWDEVLTAATHNVATSAGKRLRQINAFQQTDGTVNDAGATTTSFVTDLASSVDNFYNDSMLVFTDGALAGQVRAIIDYVGATKTITLEEALTSAPVNGVAFTIVSIHIHPVSQIQTAVLTTQMTESYAADGVAPTLAQAIFLIQQAITEFTISGTTTTIKKIDGSTTAATLTLNDGTTPTGVTRAT